MNINMNKRSITKVMVKANVGLVVTHEGERDRKGTRSIITEQVSAQADPEFDKAMKKCAAALIKSTQAGLFEHALRQGDLEGVLDAKQLNETITKSLNYISKSTTVTQIRAKYDEGEMASVKVFGVFANHLGETMVAHSPQIELGGQSAYGWESSLAKNIVKVFECVKEYLEGKYSQIAFEVEEEPAEEPAEEKASRPAKAKAKAATKKSKDPELDLDMNFDDEGSEAKKDEVLDKPLKMRLEKAA